MLGVLCGAGDLNWDLPSVKHVPYFLYYVSGPRYFFLIGLYLAVFRTFSVLRVTPGGVWGSNMGCQALTLYLTT